MPIGDFRLSITEAMHDQLQKQMSARTISVLRSPTVTFAAPAVSVPLDKGVYQLLMKPPDYASLYAETGAPAPPETMVVKDKTDADWVLLYVGKSSDTGLIGRLTEHARKLSGREIVQRYEIHYRALRVEEDLDAVAPEKMLIGSSAIAWNGSGFGPHDPGRDRDTTRLKAGHFDQLFPIDLNMPVDLTGHATWDLSDALTHASETLPYTLRMDRRQLTRDITSIGAGAPTITGSRTVSALQLITDVQIAMTKPEDR